MCQVNILSEVACSHMLSSLAIFSKQWQHLQMTHLSGPVCGSLSQHITSISSSSLSIHFKLFVNTQIYACRVIISISGGYWPQDLLGE